MLLGTGHREGGIQLQAGLGVQLALVLLGRHRQGQLLLCTGQCINRVTTIHTIIIFIIVPGRRRRRQLPLCIVKSITLVIIGRTIVIALEGCLFCLSSLPCAFLLCLSLRPLPFLPHPLNVYLSPSFPPTPLKFHFSKV